MDHNSKIWPTQSLVPNYDFFLLKLPYELSLNSCIIVRKTQNRVTVPPNVPTIRLARSLGRYWCKSFQITDSSFKYHCQVNFCFHLARHYNWLCFDLPRLVLFKRLPTTAKINLYYRGKTRQRSAKEMVTSG